MLESRDYFGYEFNRVSKQDYGYDDRPTALSDEEVYRKYGKAAWLRWLRSGIDPRNPR